LILYFTHYCPIDYMLPGIAPTGRRVAVPHVVVMKFKGHKVALEHIYWDQAGVLAQIVSSTQANCPSPEPSKPRHSWKNRGASEREPPNYKPSDLPVALAPLQSRQDARHRRAGDAARPRRRGDRVRVFFAAVRESPSAPLISRGFSPNWREKRACR